MGGRTQPAEGVTWWEEPTHQTTKGAKPIPETVNLISIGRYLIVVATKSIFVETSLPLPSQPVTQHQTHRATNPTPKHHPRTRV